jgi:predicted enzyme related to lactoylglutathione lyase
MLTRDSYPAGVPCWLDLMQPDPEPAMEFFRGLFGWTFERRTPPDAPSSYYYATLDGATVGAVGGPPKEGEPAGWNTYVCVDSADASAATVEANGGRILAPAEDFGQSGRGAVCADPTGAVFGVWQPGENRGAQLVNAPGSWNFSELYTPDTDAAARFYGAVFGWECDPLEIGGEVTAWMFRVPGYGKFLADGNPEIADMQETEQAPPGFIDAVALMMPAIEAGAKPYWNVTFAVADADASFARALQLGASVVTPLYDTDYTRQGMIADPQGAVLGLSEYRPPEPA